ncbi:MAG: radical SAM protein [Candidatus Omnitrophica bacterium]|nr:radical SAM protein [Candidatus Omnitrophota bacterium]
MNNKKKIVLLFPDFKEGFVMGKVPLGLAYIASMLESRGHYVEGYNLIVDPLKDIDFEKFDFCGITCLTSFINEVRRVSEYVKEKNPTIKIVIGGPHPSVETEGSLFISDKIDFVISGQGENPFLELIESSPGNIEKITGLYFLESGLIKGQANSNNLDISSLPLPNQRLFDHGRLEKRNPFRAILASRGCPFHCYNCQPLLDKVLPFKLRTPDSVVAEMIYLSQKYGQDYFGFIDSEFPLNKKWFKEFYLLVKKNNLKFSFHCNARSDLIDREVLTCYKDMNITRLAIGVESGSQRVVDDVLNKRINLEKTKEIFDLAAALGINTHAHFMIGIPGETLDEMRDTLDYAKSIKVSSLEFNILTPWPGTEFYRLCKANSWLEESIAVSDFNEKRLGVVSTKEWNHNDVLSFYQSIRSELQSLGWHNSDDGSVYFKGVQTV